MTETKDTTQKTDGAAVEAPVTQDTPNTEESFAEMFEKNPEMPDDSHHVGDVVKGVVVNVTRSSLFIDFGAKSEGVVPREEFTAKDGSLKISIGDNVELQIVDIDHGTISLSSTMTIRREKLMEQLADAKENNIPLYGTVTATNKGGFEVLIDGVRAFCPFSQIDLRHVDNPEEYVGLKAPFRVIEYSNGGRRVVVSRKSLLKEEAKKKAKELLDKLEAGMDVDGEVVRLAEFGAFVDLGGVEGMIHLSEMAHHHIAKAEEVLHVGQTVRTRVLKVEPMKKGRMRIALSLRALEKSPWETDFSFAEGAVVQGKVMRLADFGAFVELAPGVEGLIHLSEMAFKRINHPKDVLEQGQDVEVKVMSIDRDRRRIALSLREAQGLPPEMAQSGGRPERLRPGLRVNAMVTEHAPFGIWVSIIQGTRSVQALLPNEETGFGRDHDMKAEFPEEKVLEVMVVNTDRNRVRVSIKALTEAEERKEMEKYMKQDKALKPGKMGTLGDLLGGIKLDKN